MTLTLLDGRSSTVIEPVSSLVATDGSGQFGLLPGHAELITMLEPGLLRYRTTPDADWTYSACTGGLLYCLPAAGRTAVRIVSRRFLQGAAPEDLQVQLDQLLESERTLRLSLQDSIEHLDLSFYKRMQQLAQTGS